MKIVRLEIKKWRNFEDITLNMSPDTSLIALIGENGVGKSSILEIINSFSHRLGLSSGVDIPRGDPFLDDHELRIDVYISRTATELLPPEKIPEINSWDIEFTGHLSLESKKTGNKNTTNYFLTNDPNNPLSREYAETIVQSLRQKEDTYYLSLDADRSYPPRPIQPQEYIQSLDQDWESIQLTKHRAHSSSKNKYEEWMKYCVGTEARKATNYFQQQRLSATNNLPPSDFQDHFLSYGKSINKIFNHLQFLGVDTREKTLIFESNGVKLTFNQLSGGEKEIAFVIGQIERFQLENGILLIDEPELHLNPEMVRTWVSYLRDTVQEGQTWLATHSIEAVEAAGLECTYIIERDHISRKIKSVSTLSKRPALSILSAAVGSPAFSIYNKKFIYIEGDRQGVERDKFFRLYNTVSTSHDIRFMEGGGCTEVEKKVIACLDLSSHTDQQLHIGGIVDRDHKTEQEITRIENLGILTLPFYEIENAFIHPSILGEILRELDSEYNIYDLIRSISDRKSGHWIFRRALHRSGIRINNLRESSHYWSNLCWKNLLKSEELETAISHVDLTFEDSQDLFREHIIQAYHDYQLIRESKDLWKECKGKYVLSEISRKIGFTKQITLINRYCLILSDRKEVAEELFNSVIQYIKSL